MKQLILDYTPYCTRAALVQDGEMIDFSVERTSVRGIVGNIYKGKVENVLSGMKAAFVNIGLERNGFLFVGDLSVDCERLAPQLSQKKLNISAGDIIMCQVVKDQFGQKGARLTTDITLPGYYLVFLPTSTFLGVSRRITNSKRREYLEQLVKSVCPAGSGFIVRSAADKAADADIIAEVERLTGLWAKVQADFAKAENKSLVFEEASLFERALRDTFSEDIDSIIVNDERVANALRGRVRTTNICTYTGERNIMAHYNLSSQINHLCDRKVNMSGGAYIVIDKTEAMTVIDVNTGKFVGSKDLEDTVFRTNMAAAECIAKQLRLRNISGIVMIDFIDMIEESHKEAVVAKLEQELKKDRLKTSTIGMTQLGVVQLTRKKTRLPVDAFMLQPCTHCEGGFVISDVQVTFMLRDEMVDFMLAHKCDEVYIGVNPAIFEVVFESGILRGQAERYWKQKQIFFYASKNIRRARFVIDDKPPRQYEGDLKRLCAYGEECEQEDEQI